MTDGLTITLLGTGIAGPSRRVPSGMELQQQVRPTRTRLRSAAAVAALMLLVAMGVGGCGSSDAATGDSDEVVPVAFEGRFDQVPRAPLSDPVGSLSEKNGVTTQSFEIRGNTPKQVMAFYEKVLPSQGWTASIAPTPSGPSAYKSEWVTDAWKLRLTANSATGLGGNSDPTEAVQSQYSLELSRR